jgi:hypothetical protein
VARTRHTCRSSNSRLSYSNIRSAPRGSRCPAVARLPVVGAVKSPDRGVLVEASGADLRRTRSGTCEWKKRASDHVVACTHPDLGMRHSSRCCVRYVHCCVHCARCVRCRYCTGCGDRLASDNCVRANGCHRPPHRPSPCPRRKSKMIERMRGATADAAAAGTVWATGYKVGG